MGYTLTIGEAQIFYDADDLYMRIEAAPHSEDGAPAHDPFTGTSNTRSPSYTTWKEVCDEAGISPLFYGGGWDRNHGMYTDCPQPFHRNEPLLRHHPGAVPICQADLDYLRAARKRREETNGGRLPGFREKDEIDNGTDAVLARLLWLEFWFAWALLHCQRPIFENS